MLKFWKRLNRYYDRLLRLLLIPVLLIAAWCIWDNYYVYSRAENDDLLRYKPGQSDGSGGADGDSGRLGRINRGILGLSRQGIYSRTGDDGCTNRGCSSGVLDALELAACDGSTAENVLRYFIIGPHRYIPPFPEFSLAADAPGRRLQSPAFQSSA